MCKTLLVKYCCPHYGFFDCDAEVTKFRKLDRNGNFDGTRTAPAPVVEYCDEELRRRELLADEMASKPACAIRSNDDVGIPCYYPSMCNEHAGEYIEDLLKMPLYFSYTDSSNYPGDDGAAHMERVKEDVARVVNHAKWSIFARHQRQVVLQQEKEWLRQFWAGPDNLQRDVYATRIGSEPVVHAVDYGKLKTTEIPLFCKIPNTIGAVRLEMYRTVARTDCSATHLRKQYSTLLRSILDEKNKAGWQTTQAKEAWPELPRHHQAEGRRGRDAAEACTRWTDTPLGAGDMGTSR
ncbi:hypothetical protein B0T26DRAFT_753492 [Lasiosphaeria miniovina]|uniref:Uncharacterized protein n=1 Tax=Lasiosphaeria miniovina TaxID=1954250 RepID=A0AA40ACI7_9PEZI|nr:uncharacterized protein B0T26DRAFT_753492 [Lasiosphaeria miniovina]KAK0713378.1 hypothetical protein B0T26DRAFT_753492 [Lasiosphaeria miniovina]